MKLIWLSAFWDRGKCWTESELWTKNRIQWKCSIWKAILDIFFWAQLRHATDLISMQSWMLVLPYTLLNHTGLARCQNSERDFCFIFSRSFLFVQIKMQWRNAMRKKQRDVFSCFFFFFFNPEGQKLDLYECLVLDWVIIAHLLLDKSNILK